MVEDGVDDGAEEVEHAADVEEHVHEGLEAAAPWLRHVNDEQALRVERRPAKKEDHHHSNCKHTIDTLS